MRKNKHTPEKKFIDILFPLRIIVGTMFSLIILFTLAQIIFRFVFASPLIWSEELSRFILVWMTFLGAAVLAWDGRHLCVDVFFNGFSKTVQNAIRRLSMAIIVIFLTYVMYHGWIVVKLEKYNEIGALTISGSYYMLPFFVGGGLIIFALLARFFYRLNRKDDSSTM